MRIGLIDVDNRERLHDCFPNICLMKISAYHKRRGDTVEWVSPLFGGHYDRVYMSKVFSFSPDYEYFIDADEVIKGGSGYAIRLVDDKEVYDKTIDNNLPYEIEHMMPDYSLYFNDSVDFDMNGKLTRLGVKHRDTAYGFMSRGCPRGCDFCHVKSKDGLRSVKVADLKEFWSGQKHIELLDPNTLACLDWEDILTQLIESKAKVCFNQGLDIRMMTTKKAEMLSKINVEKIHFAWDRYEDKDIIQPLFEKFRQVSHIRNKDLQVYVLTNFNSTHVQDLYRVEWLKEHGFAPYVMVYNKHGLPKGHITLRLQRYVNNRAIFWSIGSFAEYKRRADEQINSVK